jgi:hypothetical protein
MSDIPSNGLSTEPSLDPAQPHANGLRAFARVGKFLEEDGWHPQKLEETHVYRMYFSGKNGEIACFAQVRVELEQFLFYAITPLRVPEEARPVVAEYLTRANYGLRIGNFEMDYADGEVRYKSSIDFEGETLSDNLIRNTIYPAIQTMDHYLPGLMAVMYGGKTPLDAITEIETNM